MSPSTIKDHRAKADLTLNLGPEYDVVPSGQLISAEALHGELRMAPAAGSGINMDQQTALSEWLVSGKHWPLPPCWPCWPCWSGTHWPLFWMGLHIPPLNGPDKGHTWVMEVMNILLGWFRDSSSKHEQSINQDSPKKNHPTNSSSRIWSLDIDEGAYRRHIAGSCGICHGFWTLDIDVNSTRQIAIKLRKQAVPDVSRCLNDKGPF